MSTKLVRETVGIQHMPKIRLVKLKPKWLALFLTASIIKTNFIYPSLDSWWFEVVVFLEPKQSKQPLNQIKVTGNNHFPKLSASSSGKSTGQVS